LINDVNVKLIYILKYFIYTITHVAWLSLEKIKVFDALGPFKNNYNYYTEEAESQNQTGNSWHLEFFEFILLLIQIKEIKIKETYLQ